MKFNCLLILMLLLNSISPLYGKGFDLIGWNGEQEYILEGEWSFKNRQLFDPSRITEKEIETWASWPIPHASYDDSNKFNFASFATTLTGLEPGGIVTFAFPRVISAAHYYLIYADGTVEDLGGSGVPATNKDQIVAQFNGHHKVVSLKDRKAILLIHTAHRYINNFGLGSPIKIYKPEQWNAHEKWTLFVSMAMFGILFAFTAYFSDFSVSAPVERNIFGWAASVWRS